MNTTLYENVAKAGWTGFFIGFLLGAMMVGFLTTVRSPLDYGRTCDEAAEVAVLLVQPDGKSRQTACLERWRVVIP